MKINLMKYWIAFLPCLMLIFMSCEKEFPKNVDSPDKAELKSIKLINAGADGNTVLEGTIDEVRKTVSFPRLDTLTDFSNLIFEAEMSPGAQLDKESYSVEFDEGESSKTIVVKVVNNKRFREYLVTLRLLIPVFGADFESPVVYDNSNSDEGNPIHPAFSSLLTRGSGFDGESVLIVTRHEMGSHLLRMEDIRDDNTINPIPLNMEGVSGGTLVVNVGAQVNGHTYIANLSGGHASPFRIYHWTDPDDEAEVIADLNTGEIPNAGDRHGDNMSVNLDENGNGYMYFGDNAVQTILRLKVTNYTEISDPTVLDNASGSTFVMTFNQVDQTDDYIFTGYEAPIRVADESARIKYELSGTAVPQRGVDARVVHFNGERYLIMTTAARSGSDAVVLYVYDITRGDDVVEALQIFEERSDQSPIFQYGLLGPVNIAPGTQANFHITKNEEGEDEMLTLYAASADAGFVVIDFPKKTLD